MKKLILLALLFGTVSSCSNPLDLVYNELTFNNDIKLIKNVNEKDSDRIIDQVKYAEEIKPGMTYKEILEDYHQRKDLLIKILEFYEQERSKENFDFKDYIQIDINSKKGLKSYSWSWNNDYEYNTYVSVKNICDKTIKLGIIYHRGGKLLKPQIGEGYYFENIFPNDSTSFERKLTYEISFPLSASLQIGDSIFYNNYAYKYIGDQCDHLYSKGITQDVIEYYEEQKDSINKFDLVSKIDDDFEANKDLTFEDVIAGYKNEKLRNFKESKESFQYVENILLERKKNNAIKETQRRKRELSIAEAKRKKEALIKNQKRDRLEFISILNQYNIDDFNLNYAIGKYDKMIKGYNLVWDDEDWIPDDFDRLIVKNKTLTGSGNYKSLKVNFKGFTLKKEEEMYSIIIPVK